jgi:hypothetical protein
MTYYHDIMELIGSALDAVGVLIIVIGAVIAAISFAAAGKTDFGAAYRSYRRPLALASWRRAPSGRPVGAGPHR